MTQLPGVYLQNVFPAAQPSFLTGVPIFLGFTTQGDPNQPQLLTAWLQFVALFGGSPKGGYLETAVRGFFENGGLLCYVLPLEPAVPNSVDGFTHSLLTALSIADTLPEADLICVPDAVGIMVKGTTPAEIISQSCAYQQQIISHCERLGTRFAILDTPPVSLADLLNVENPPLPKSDFAACYAPWLTTHVGTVPPSGHIAGSFSQTDEQIGPHKAPANQPLLGVLDLHPAISRTNQAELQNANINGIFPFAGRGIRVYGARTLADQPLSVRRLLITVRRWLERLMESLVQEPNNFRLWVRIMREVAAYLDGLYRLGALNGRIPEEAYYVKCDSETNPPRVQEAGQVITEIGLAPVQPAEFIILRVLHGDSGVSIND